MRSRKARPYLCVIAIIAELSKQKHSIVTPNHLLFCRIQTVGSPANKDCLEDYIRSKRNVRKKATARKKPMKKKKKSAKKEKEKIIKKFDDYLFELKLKQWRQRASK